VILPRTVVRLAFAVLLATGATTFDFDGTAAQTSAPAKPESVTAPKMPAALPPDVAFGRFIALIRGHLLTGEELVKQRDWRNAHAHFMFPLEEICGVIREDLRGYKTPPFDGALKALAKVEAALTAADADLKSRQLEWPRFELTVAVELVKTAAEEYQDALANGRIAHPVGYRTARGFILQADRMVEGVAGDLAVKNADALRDLRDGFSQLKQAFAAVDAPRRPPIDDASLGSVVSRITLAAGKLM